MSDSVQTTDSPNKVRRQAMYEVQLFAQEAGISIEQAKEIMDRFGHDRETLMREAGKLLKKMS